MRTLGEFVGVLLLIGFIGAYFWPIALTIAAAWVTYQLVLCALKLNTSPKFPGVGGLDVVGADGGRSASRLVKLCTGAGLGLW
jgi:hypothetical protein